MMHGAYNVKLAMRYLIQQIAHAILNNYLL